MPGMAIATRAGGIRDRVTLFDVVKEAPALPATARTCQFGRQGEIAANHIKHAANSRAKQSRRRHQAVIFNLFEIPAEHYSAREQQGLITPMQLEKNRKSKLRD
jgi:hypothetical protein